MSISWRLIDDGPASGPWNMGVDEALVRSALRTNRASLRLYSWSGSWLSLGYAQRRFLDLERLQKQEPLLGVIRRVTGGRAVLHGNDLTYAVAAPEHSLAAGLRGSYEQISTALLAAVQSLGLTEAVRAPLLENAAGPKPFDCFAETSGDEICVGGRKLCGSAQRRIGGAVLQHGSIRIRADPPKRLRAAGLDPDVATSFEELGNHLDEGKLRAALIDAFAESLGASFEVSEIDSDEYAIAAARSDLNAREPLAVPPIETCSNSSRTL